MHTNFFLKLIFSHVEDIEYHTSFSFNLIMWMCHIKFPVKCANISFVMKCGKVSKSINTFLRDCVLKFASFSSLFY